MRMLYLIHDPRWTESRVTDLLVERGVFVEYRCHQTGDPLPTIEEFTAFFDGLIIGGGTVSVDRAESQPFLTQQIALTRTVVDAGHRFFGICLGGQILAAAFGASTAGRPDGRTEFGFWPITPTPAGAELFAGVDHVYQVHDEGLTELPPEAELLAGSEWFPYQAFRIGRRAYGVQFHPDARAEAIESWWYDNVRLHGRIGTQTLAEQRRGVERYDPQRLRWLNRFLDHWLLPAEPVATITDAGETPMAHRTQP